MRPSASRGLGIGAAVDLRSGLHVHSSLPPLPVPSTPPAAGTRGRRGWAKPLVTHPRWVTQVKPGNQPENLEHPVLGSQRHSHSIPPTSPPPHPRHSSTWI